MAISNDIPRFEGGLQVLADLRRSGSLRLIAGVPGVLAPKIELLEGGERDDHLRRRLTDARLKREDFEAVAAEVAEILEVILSGRNIEDGIRGQKVDGSDQVTRDTLQKKQELVSKAFGPDLRGLNDRQWIKSTAKTEVLSSINWDVSLKHGTDSDDNPREHPVPVAVVQLMAIPPVEFGALKERSVAMTLDGEDIQYLLDTLERLYAAYQELAR